MKVVCICVLLICVIEGFSQDIIIRKNGDELQVKVLEITNSEVSFKKISNIEGPNYTLSKDEIFMIKYENGDKDVFSDESLLHKNQMYNKEYVCQSNDAIGDSNNQKLINLYNTYNNAFKCDIKRDKAKAWTGTLGVTAASVLSTDEIEIVIRSEDKSYFCFPYDYKGEILKDKQEPCYELGKFYIEIYNKTSQNIYLDKKMSFRVDSNKDVYSYYNNKIISVNQGSGSGVGLNLGAISNAIGFGGVGNTLASGINVGVGRQSSITTTEIEQRILNIPPNGKIVLSKDDIALVESQKAFSLAQYTMISFSEDFNNVKFEDLKLGEYRKYDEINTPAIKQYTLHYSNDLEFKTSKDIQFGLYLKDVIGCRRVHKDLGLNIRFVPLMYELKDIDHYTVFVAGGSED